MEHLLNTNVKNIEISGIRQFSNLVAQYDHVLSFTIGQPDFETPLHIKEFASEAIMNNATTYTHNAGTIQLRQRVASFFKETYALSYNPASEVIVTTGASEAIDITFRTLLSPGDEVLLPAPIYPGYEPIIRMCGAIPIYIDTRSSGFKVTAEQIKEKITTKTKCLVLPYPSNPTGVSLTADELASIAALLSGKDIFILADEIYSELTFDRKHISIATFLREQTIVINGLSKSHAMTGWRIGFLLAPESICHHILKVHQYNVSCASSVSQMAALEAMTNGLNDPSAMRTEYKKRRDYVYERLLNMGLETVCPDGAFYFFVKQPSHWKTSMEFALALVEQKRVAVVPGSAFSHYGEGYFRLSYATSLEALQQGLDLLEQFLQETES